MLNSPQLSLLPPPPYGDTALTLGQIAQTNYKAYPEISSEIEEAATAVDRAVKVLNTVINTLQYGLDLKSGWNGLVEACLEYCRCRTAFGQLVNAKKELDMELADEMVPHRNVQTARGIGKPTATVGIKKNPTTQQGNAKKG